MTVAKQVLGFFARYSIRYNRTLFEDGRNPFHAWKAFRWARRNNEPIPEWVLDYFDRCAERLERTKPTKPKEIAKVFEMAPIGGGPSFASQAATASDRLKAAQMVRALKEECPAMSLTDDICPMIGEQLGKSEGYVEKAYYEFFP